MVADTLITTGVGASRTAACRPISRYSEYMALKIYEHLVVGPLACNCYLIGDPDTKQAIVIDPGDDPSDIVEAVARYELEVVAMVATHAHFDHVLAADQLRSYTGAPLYLHGDDTEVLEWLPESMSLFFDQPPSAAPPTVDAHLADGDEVKAGGLRLEVIHTPGHSPGSICLAEPDGVLFSGDTLFAASVGRTDLLGGDFDQIVSSIRERLFPLGDRDVYPGHGPRTSIDREKVINPFVGTGGSFHGP
jgi:hydroxyacylglutathione hydrolase